MSVLDAVRDLQNQTAWQKSQDAAKIRADSIDPNNRNVGSVMGKNDFLMLLSAQLRYQDPLNPQSDGEFASQLAQFSSLEQMQNMNETLNAMAGYQAYSLIGKYVIAEAYEVVDGIRQLVEIPGIVDAIFTRDGKTYAQIGDFTVLVSSITDVFDGSVLLSPDSLQQASNSLLGRTVKAQIGEDIYEGLVISVTVDKGILFARIDVGSGEPKLVPVGSIFEIGQTGVSKPVVQETIPERLELDRPNLIASGDGFIETDDEGRNQYGRWDWNVEAQKWVATGFSITNSEGAQVGSFVWNADTNRWDLDMYPTDNAPPVTPPEPTEKTSSEDDDESDSTGGENDGAYNGYDGAYGGGDQEGYSGENFDFVA